MYTYHLLRDNSPLVEGERDLNRGPLRCREVFQDLLDVDRVCDLEFLLGQQPTLLWDFGHIQHVVRRKGNEPFARYGGSLTFLLVSDKFLPDAKK